MNESIKSEASIQKYLFAGFVVSTTDQFHAHFHLNSNVSIVFHSLVAIFHLVWGKFCSQNLCSN